MNDNVCIMAAVESAVADTFHKRFGGRKMSWERARELVLIEREIIDNIAFEIQAALKGMVEDEKRVG